MTMDSPKTNSNILIHGPCPPDPRWRSTTPGRIANPEQLHQDRHHHKHLSLLSEVPPETRWDLQYFLKNVQLVFARSNPVQQHHARQRNKFWSGRYAHLAPTRSRWEWWWWWGWSLFWQWWWLSAKDRANSLKFTRGNLMGLLSTVSMHCRRCWWFSWLAAADKNVVYDNVPSVRGSGQPRTTG